MAGTVRSRSSAASFADQSSTSHRISAARCLAGRNWMAARYASPMFSFAATAASGCSDLGTAGSSRRSGNGCRYSNSPSAVGLRWSWCFVRKSRQALVAMPYSQARSDDRPSNVARLRQARSNVSCTMSSASSKDPSIRYACTRSGFR